MFVVVVDQLLRPLETVKLDLIRGVAVLGGLFFHVRLGIVVQTQLRHGPLVMLVHGGDLVVHGVSH